GSGRRDVATGREAPRANVPPRDTSSTRIDERGVDASLRSRRRTAPDEGMSRTADPGRPQGISLRRNLGDARSLTLEARMHLHPLYRYVGPAEIATAARSRSGALIATRNDLVTAYRDLGGRRDPMVCT